MDDREDGEFFRDRDLDNEELSPYQLEDLYDNEIDDSVDEDDEDINDFGIGGVPAY